jgi:UDPglucose 6-dehydrogenase
LGAKQVNLCIIGSGYVGLVAGACLADAGNQVVCVDISADKIAMLQAGEVPIYEPGLAALIARNRASKRLDFTTELAPSLAASEMVFIAVGTPEDEDGSADLSHVLTVAKQIAEQATSPKLVVTKSTVPVGTADKIRATLRQHSQLPHRVASNPEFLKEGAAIADFQQPDRIIIGCDDAQSQAELERLYAPFNRRERRIIAMSVRSAELTKYASNAMLATRISFMNELANLCDDLGADIADVRYGMGSDKRIGPHFLFPGCGYGGSCFPKDVKALAHMGRQLDRPMQVIEAVERANALQRSLLAQRVVETFGEDLSGRCFALWGLAFKAKTDDMREAPSRVIIEELAGRGAQIVAHDPVAIDTARGLNLPNTRFEPQMYDALSGCDALIICTDWNDYRSPDFGRIKNLLSGSLILDGRNLLDPQQVAQAGLSYRGIGRSMEPQT